MDSTRNINIDNNMKENKLLKFLSNDNAHSIARLIAVGCIVVAITFGALDKLEAMEKFLYISLSFYGINKGLETITDTIRDSFKSN